MPQNSNSLFYPTDRMVDRGDRPLIFQDSHHSRSNMVTKSPLHFYYRPQTKLQKGNVFTSVCQEFCPQGEGGVHHLWADTPPPPTATAVDGTHPTGMHSCSNFKFS